MGEPQKKQDMGKSVFDRLKRGAKEHGENVNFILERYSIERLLYRLSISPYAERFVLKGGALFLAWQGKSYRVTRDLDLLGYGSAQVADLEAIFRALCVMEVRDDDGIVFLPDTVKGAELREEALYSGIRIKLDAKISNAHLHLQVDIGFSDVVTPEAESIVYPTLLDMPRPRIRAYTRYTVIAEKFEIMVSLGIGNSRMKDFYDIWLMMRLFDFEGDLLKHAVENTFQRRQTQFPQTTPFAFTEEFYADPSKRMQWEGFKKGKIETFDEELSLESTIKDIARFLLPVIEAIRQNVVFSTVWSHDQRAWIGIPITS